MTFQQFESYLETHGVSMAEFAEMVGLHPNTPYRWKAGRGVPRSVALFIGLAIKAKLPPLEAAHVASKALKAL